MKFVALLILAASAAFSQASITVGNGSGAPGAVVQIPVLIASSSPVASIQFDIVSAAAISKVELGNTYASYKQLANNPANGRSIVYGMNATVIGDGPLAYLTLTLPATAGTYTVAPQNAIAASPEASQVNVAVSPGTLTVTGSTTPPPPPPTNQPPTVVINSPLNGATVSGTVQISATATDDVNVRATALYIDDYPVLDVAGGTATFAWDTTKYSGGAHTITALASDDPGTFGVLEITVYVSNTSTPPPPPTPPPPSTDTTPPSITITKPLNNSTIARVSQTFTCTATDNVGVTGIQFVLNSINLGGSQTQCSITVNVPTVITGRGWNSLTAIATDAAGNKTTAPVIRFKVQ